MKNLIGIPVRIPIISMKIKNIDLSFSSLVFLICSKRQCDIDEQTSITYKMSRSNFTAVETVRFPVWKGYFTYDQAVKLQIMRDYVPCSPREILHT